MTDLEITKLCAEAMGYSVVNGDKRFRNGMQIATVDGDPVTCWRPLEDDKQAMALVKKFRLCVLGSGGDQDYTGWQVNDAFGNPTCADTANRAICECVAKMQAAKK